MKPKALNQEILPFAGPSCTGQEFCVMNVPGNKPSNISLIEELERACRAGILYEPVPELTPNPFSYSNLCIWNIPRSEHFLLINQVIYPHPVETETPVDSLSISSPRSS